MTAAAASSVQEAMAALRRGDAAAARRAAESAIAAGAGGAGPAMLLAEACRMGGDEAGEAAALDRALAADPRSIGALILRGDAYGRKGDMRAATSFYREALAAAAGASAVPPGIAAELQRVEALVRASGSHYQAHLESALRARGVDPAVVGPRFEEAIDILFERKRVYLQQPSALYYPRLPQIQFYERERFDWAPAFEAETRAIREELTALVESGASFSPYVEAEPDRPRQDFHGMLGDPSWGAFYLWRDGAPVAENAARCPRTMAALEKVPLSRIGSRTPSVLFSRLDPGAHIPPHTGMLNCRLICHLPLVVPEGCWLRVGNETRAWEEGKLLIFDDSIEHEAKNPTGETRIILLFDIWRPELDEAERRGLSAIFEAIDGFPAAAPPADPA